MAAMLAHYVEVGFAGQKENYRDRRDQIRICLCVKNCKQTKEI